MQNKMYGSHTGGTWAEKGVRLWMPSKQLRADNVKLNYIAAAQRDNRALTPPLPIKAHDHSPARSTIDPSLSKTFRAKRLIRSFTGNKTTALQDSSFNEYHYRPVASPAVATGYFNTFRTIPGKDTDRHRRPRRERLDRNKNERAKTPYACSG